MLTLFGAYASVVQLFCAAKTLRTAYEPPGNHLTRLSHKQTVQCVRALTDDRSDCILHLGTEQKAERPNLPESNIPTSADEEKEV